MACSVRSAGHRRPQRTTQSRRCRMACRPSGTFETAHRESTPTRERVCINGLWRWQPARDAIATRCPAPAGATSRSPAAGRASPTTCRRTARRSIAHPSWKDEKLGDVTAAWYQREITVPAQWAGRRIALHAEYLNSFATVLVDGKQAGEMRFPGGEVDLTPVCRPGATHVLSLLVVAMPLKGVMLSYSDTASAREVKGSVARRGLCGDVYLSSTPAGPRIGDVKVDTSVRQWRSPSTRRWRTWPPTRSTPCRCA